MYGKLPCLVLIQVSVKDYSVVQGLKLRLRFQSRFKVSFKVAVKVEGFIQGFGQGIVFYVQKVTMFF